MNDCSAWREALALDLYEELDAEDAVRLNDHLTGCAACREFRASLGEGLGRLSPPTWLRRLRFEEGNADGPARPVSRSTPWRVVVGFAAGILVGFFVAGSGDAGDVSDGRSARVEPVPAGAEFRRADAPPLATAESPLASLDVWLSR